MVSNEIHIIRSFSSSPLVRMVYGFWRYHFFPRKTILFMMGSMRCGSTLLKALLAQAPDVSNLPETHYTHVLGNKYLFYGTFYGSSPQPIIFLKKPQWFFEEFHPIQIPPGMTNVKVIVLFRNAYDTIVSLRKLGKTFEQINFSNDKLIEYWCQTYDRALDSAANAHPAVFYLNYDDLIDDPITMTKQLFAFIGSVQKEGTDKYEKPKDYEWKWGKDDAGEKIQKLKVVKPNKTEQDQALRDLINRSPHVRDVCAKFERLRKSSDYSQKKGT